MKTQNVKIIAEKVGRELTSKGNLKIGSHDQGSHGTPGSQAYNEAVCYYLLSDDGDYQVVIDDRWGSNQGRINKWNGGDITRMDGATLDEVIQLAQDHIESMDNADGLMRAWRIASSEARATMRKADREAE